MFSLSALHRVYHELWSNQLQRGQQHIYLFARFRFCIRVKVRRLRAAASHCRDLSRLRVCLHFSTLVTSVLKLRIADKHLDTHRTICYCERLDRISRVPSLRLVLFCWSKPRCTLHGLQQIAEPSVRAKQRVVVVEVQPLFQPLVMLLDSPRWKLCNWNQGPRVVVSKKKSADTGV